MQLHHRRRIWIDIDLRMRVRKRATGGIEVVHVVGAVLHSPIGTVNLPNESQRGGQVVSDNTRRELVQCEPVPGRKDRHRCVLRIGHRVWKQDRFTLSDTPFGANGFAVVDTPPSTHGLHAIQGSDGYGSRWALQAQAGQPAGLDRGSRLPYTRSTLAPAGYGRRPRPHR